jgi:23S rRNA pseudouridine2605 synthase
VKPPALAKITKARRMTPMAGKEKPETPTTPAGERIAKVLSRAGIASRREAERLIELGEVKVNGKTITSPALNVTAADKITVRGEPVGQPEPPRLWLYYKPEGLVTSAADEKGRDTVFDHLPEDMPRVMSVGRLDLNSEGLLLLTNDGELKRRLELPSTGWLRKYRVRVKGNPTEPEIEPLRKGITVEGDRFQPMEVKIDRHQGANAWLTVGLREGKNREIRRAMTHIGLTVNRLIRVSYGPFRLNEMKPGEVEEIKPRILREQLGLADDDADGPKARPPVRRSLAPKPGKQAERQADTLAKPKARLKPGEGQRMLSEAWQKATRPLAARPASGQGDDRPAKAPTRGPRPASRTGPRPKGPRGG